MPSALSLVLEVMLIIVCSVEVVGEPDANYMMHIKAALGVHGDCFLKRVLPAVALSLCL